MSVPLETTDVCRPVVQRALAVVTERRMPEVVGEAGGVHDIRVEPQALCQFSADLGDLERVCQPIAHEIEPCDRAEHLRFGCEPAQRARVQNACTITGEITATVRMLLGEGALRIRL